MTKNEIKESNAFYTLGTIAALAKQCRVGDSADSLERIRAALAKMDAANSVGVSLYDKDLAELKR